MKLHRQKSGSYKADNGLLIRRQDGAWFVLTEGYEILHKCPSLADARHIVGLYNTQRDITDALMLRSMGRGMA